ncbi:hypothetical protein O6H91_01G165100 [Diphasiastrum complanatum]|uniref:Uncharacterized protein n=2 Tax=Diphasiastrum complanatum TaxID=34168 RepID=A0ACC2EYB9_DIPCM|nr:hypothetical protein O6H91_01G165100 [Diphasiastrum complanatum]KAJ7571511.1 hypothetical protein O6H91_01G165100 [Diphasiastrum complanatum]
MVSAAKSKGNVRHMSERPHHASDSGPAAAYRVPFKGLFTGTGGLEQNSAAEALHSIANPKWSFFGNPCLVLTRSGACGGISATGKKGSKFAEVDAVSSSSLAGKGLYGTSLFPAKDGSDLCTTSKEDCKLRHWGMDANELPRVPDVTMAGATRAAGRDTLQQVTDKKYSKEAELTVMELEEARRQMIASASERRTITKGEGSQFFGMAQRRPYKPESMFLEPGAPNSGVDALGQSHSDDGSRCKVETVKSDFYKPYSYSSVGLPLNSKLPQQSEGKLSEDANAKPGSESALEGSTFLAYATVSPSLGWVDKPFGNGGITVSGLSHIPDQEKFGAAEPVALKFFCSKRKAPIDVEDAPLQRKYGMSEKNERIIPIEETLLRKLEQDRKETSLNSAMQDKGKFIKDDHKKKKRFGVVGITQKVGSTNINRNFNEAIANHVADGHAKRSFMKWMLNVGKGLARTQQGFAGSMNASSRLLKVASVRDLKNTANFIGVVEKPQGATFKTLQHGEASTGLNDQGPSIDPVVKPDCREQSIMMFAACNGSRNSQNSRDKVSVDCKQELAVTDKARDQNKLAKEMDGMSSYANRSTYRSETSMEKNSRELYNSPVLREGYHPSAEGNVASFLQSKAKADEKTIAISLSLPAAKNQSQCDFSTAMVHKPPSCLTKNVHHNLGAVEDRKAGYTWISRYIAGAKMPSPNSQAQISADPPTKANHILAAEGFVQRLEVETYSESYHSFQAHDAIKNGTTDVGQELALQITAGNEGPGEITNTLCLEVLPGVLYPTEGSGDLPSPRGIAEFAAAMKAVKTWINETSSCKKECQFQISNSIQVCKFCGMQGHTFHECSETLDSELGELRRRARVWEDMTVEVGDILCLRCLVSGHWGAQCHQFLKGAAAHSQEQHKLLKDEINNKLQTRDKMSVARPIASVELSSNAQRSVQLPSLPKNASYHRPQSHLNHSGSQNETKSQNKRSNSQQKCQAKPNSNKLAENNTQPLMTNRGCSNLQSPEESIIEHKGEESPGMEKKGGELAVQQKRKRRAKVVRQIHDNAQDSKRIAEKHLKKSASPGDTSNKAADTLPAQLQRANKNWPDKFLLSIPRKMLICVESVRLSRSELWKSAGSLNFSAHILGFFLRLRFGHLDEELGGTGYRMGRIKGAVTKNLIGKRKIAVSVDLGDIECIVDGKFISNQCFTQLELVNWWCGMRLKDKLVPHEDELGRLFEQRCQWQLE